MALFKWQEDKGWGCPEGMVWSVRQGQCIPKRFQTESEHPTAWENVGATVGNVAAGIGDTLRGCPPGTMWDREAGECRKTTDFYGSKPDPNAEVPTWWDEYQEEREGYVSPTSTDKGVDECDEGFVKDATGNCVPVSELPITGDLDPTIPDEPITPDTPPGFTEGLDQVMSDLSGWLTADASQATEDQYWQTKMDRLDEEYQESVDQMEENLNVKGLYYSGVRAETKRKMDEDFLQLKAEEEAKFQYERFDREVQRNTMAMQYALGARAQEIQWALGKGQLDLQQLDLALQETLGITSLQLKEQGLLNDFIIGMYNVGISQETNQIARDQMWLNTVALLRQMGIGETEIQNIATQISGVTTGPPV